MRPRSIPEETIRAMRAETLTYREIAAKYGISMPMAVSIMLNHSYHSALYHPTPRAKRVRLDDWQVKDIRTSEEAAKTIGAKHGVPAHTVYNIRQNQVRHSAIYHPKDRRRKLTDAQIRQIVTSRKTQVEMASMLGVSQPLVSYYRRKFATAV